MIDIEYDLFNILSTALRTEFDGISVYGEIIKEAPSFPTVIIIEADNAVEMRTSSSDNVENHVQVVYEINVYTNDLQGKKRKAKDIMSLIDNIMLSYGFTRMISGSIANLEDVSIYRMVARYEAIIDKNKTIYRR